MPFPLFPICLSSLLPSWPYPTRHPPLSWTWCTAAFPNCLHWRIRQWLPPQGPQFENIWAHCLQNDKEGVWQDMNTRQSIWGKHMVPIKARGLLNLILRFLPYSFSHLGQKTDILLWRDNFVLGNCLWGHSTKETDRVCLQTIGSSLVGNGIWKNENNWKLILDAWYAGTVGENRRWVQGWVYEIICIQGSGNLFQCIYL